MCKLIIAGSRSIKNYAHVRDAIINSGLWKKYGKKIIVVSGTAQGADTLGEEFAEKNNLAEPKKFPADWENIKAKGAAVRSGPKGKYNALAGHWRNEKMAQYADECLIIWDGKSTGSLDMLHRMIALDKPVYLYPLAIGVDAYDSLVAKGVNIILPKELDEEDDTHVQYDMSQVKGL